MALGDVGMFLPKEAQYGTPGAYDKMLQAEAQKRAAYLSSMDQFYENLDEAQRQFDETLGFKTETRDLELEWAKEKQKNELAFSREGLEAQKAYNTGLLSLKERELGQGELDFFDKRRLWSLLEREQGSRETTRGIALERSFPESSAMATTYGKDYVNPYSSRAPESGVVNFSPQRNESNQTDWLNPENFPEANWQKDGSPSGGTTWSNIPGQTNLPDWWEENY